VKIKGINKTPYIYYKERQPGRVTITPGEHINHNHKSNLTIPVYPSIAQGIEWNNHQKC